MGRNNAARISEEGEAEHFLQPVASIDPFEECFTQLARAIRLGAVGVGEKFPPERVLSDSLGVSRTTIREAIRGLEQSGYVERRRGRYGGSFVVSEEPGFRARKVKHKIGPEILPVLEYRAILQPGAVALAARKAKKRQINQMRKAVDKMQQGDADTFLRENYRLHIMFADVADCEPLYRDVMRLELEIMDAFHETTGLLPSQSRSHDQHLKIIEAIASGDSKAAQHAMEEHLSGTDLVMRELAAPRRRRR